MQSEKLEDRTLLAVFNVDTFADVINPIDGVLSLREAVIAAGTNGDVNDTINLPAGTYSLTLTGSENSASGLDPTIGDLDIPSTGGPQNITIVGAASATTIIDAGGNSRHFHTNRAGTDIVTLNLENLTLQNGNETSGTADNGGSILTSSIVNITDTRITNNVVTGRGGAIHLTNALGGILTISGSTFDSNQAGTFGGAIRTELGTALTIRNSTFSGNQVVAPAVPPPGTGDGGAISLRTSSLANTLIESSTFTGNSAPNNGGGVSRDATSFGGGSQILRNTIVAGNTAGSANPDVDGTFLGTQEFNLIGDGGTSPSFVDGVNGNQVGNAGTPLDPMLVALADNGGPTPTHAILVGSIATDQGNSFGLTTDQRGGVRPADIPSVVNAVGGDGADIGAFEVPIIVINGVGGICIEIRLNTVNNQVEVFALDTMTLLASEPAASLAAVVVNGTDANDDKVIVNFANNLPTTFDIEFNGGVGGTDEFRFINNVDTTVDYNYSNATDGTVSFDGRVVSYTGVEHLNNRGTATTQNFNFTASNDQIGIEDIGVVSGNQSNRLNSASTTFPQTEFVTPAAAGTVNLNLGDGDDSVTTTNAITTFPGSLNVVAGNGNDVINIAQTINMGGVFRSDAETATIAAALTTTSAAAVAIDIDATTVNSNAALNAASGGVTIDATTLVDGNGAGVNIISSSAALRVTNGVGTSADPFETTISTIAGTADGSGFHISATGGTTVDTVDGSMGIAASNGGVSVVSTGPLTVNQRVTESGGGDIALTAANDGVAPEPDTLTIDADVFATGGNGSITLNGENVTVGTGATSPTVSTVGTGTIAVTAADTTSVGPNATISTAVGASDLTITTDDIAIDGTAAITAGTGVVAIRNNSNDRIIDLGTNLANRLSITDAEIDRVTAGTVRIGRTGANDPGIVVVSSTIDPANASTLHIQTGDIIQQNPGANLIVNNLAMTTRSTVSLPNTGNSVDTLAIDSGENVTFANSQAAGLTVGAVDGVNGVTAAGFVNLTEVQGDLTVSNTPAVDDISAGLTIDVTVQADNAQLIFEANSDSESTNRSHTYTADEIIINVGATITATGQIVTLQPFEAGEQIDIGSMASAADDVLELSDAELDAVSATTIRVGRNDGSATGAVNISMTTSITNATNFHVRTGSTVMQSAAISAPNMAVSAGGAVGLNAMTNDVDTLAIQSTSGDVGFMDLDDLTIGSVDGVDGVGTANGNVSVTTIMGNLSVSDTPAANDVSATGTITLQVMADDGLFSIAMGADLESTGGAHSYIADKMDIDGTITAAGQVVTLRPNENGEAIDLGSVTDAAADTLELSDAELDNITASVVRIGDGNAGAISVTQDISPANAATLSLITGSTIGGTNGITVANLATNSVGSTNLSAGNNDVDMLASSVTGAGSSFQFTDSDDLTIATIDGVVGLSTNNGNATIITGGLLTIDDDIAVGTGTLDVNSAGAVQNAGDTIMAAELCLSGIGVFALGEANDVDTIAATTTGSLTFNDVDDMTVGTVGGKVGITSNSNNVALSTGQALSIGNGAGQGINAGTGIVNLTVANGGTVEAAGSIITASELQLSGPGAGAFDLDGNNAVGLIAANVMGQLDFVTTTALDVSTSGTLVGVETNGNNASLQSTGNMSLTQELTATGARVLLTSTAGGIADNNGAANNVTSSSLGLNSATGAGHGDALETAVSILAASNSTSGNIEVVNNVAGLLTIGDVGTLIGINNTAAAGQVNLQNCSPVTVASNVTAVGDIFIKAKESVPAAAGDDLAVNAGVSIISTGGNVTLEAGDDVTLTAGSIVMAFGTVTIKGDCTNNDPGTGSTITINGTITSGSGATVNGDSDADTIIVGALGTGGLSLNGLAGDDTFTINYPAAPATFGSTISISDTTGSDTLNVNGSADAETIFIRTTAALDTVSRGATNTEQITYDTTVEALNVAGGSGNDVFDVQPSQLVPIFIDGQPPVVGDAGVPPGDTLLFDPGTNPFTVQNKNTIITNNGGGGAPFQNITFTSIESFGLSPVGTVTQRFDMDQPSKNSVAAPVTQAGYTSVRPDNVQADGLGFYWSSPLSGSDAGNGVPMGVQFGLQRDVHTANFLRTFTTEIGAANNGFYYVTVLFGDYSAARTDQFVRDADTGILLASDVDTAAGEFTHRSFYVNVTDGSLDLEFGSTAVGNSRWSVAGIELRPADNQTITGVGGTFVADGITVDTFTAMGAIPNSTVTLSTDLGTIVNTDIDPTIAGIQVAADGAGHVTVMLQRPFGSGTASVLIDDVTGAAFGCVLPVYTPGTSRRFDFNHGNSPTQAPVLSALDPDGYIGVQASDAYSAAQGYGWLSTPNSRTNRPIAVNGALADLRRDGHQGASPQIFQVDVADGTYTGIITVGSAHGPIDDMQIAANGVVIANDIDLPAETWTQITFTATVVNGMIQFEFSDPGNNKLWVVNGLELRLSTAVTPITFAGMSGTVAADGMTTTTITTNPTGLTPGSTVTVGSSVGKITTADTNPNITGTQVLVGAGGVVSFDVQSPTIGGTPTLTVTAIDGSAIGSVNDPAFLTFDIPTVRRLDFNFGNEITQAGFTSVLASDLIGANTGFGYLGATPNAYDSSQPISVVSEALYRDGHSGTQFSSRTFQVRVKPATAYDLRAYVGSQFSDLDNVEIRVEGTTVVAPSTTAFNFTTATLLGLTDTNADDLLTIEFVDAGGTSNHWSINGLDIAEAGNLPASAPLLANLASGGRVDPGRSAESSSVDESTDADLTKVQLDSVYSAALEFWRSVGLTESQLSTLENVELVIEDLDEAGALGLAGSSVVKIDDDALGHGWHVNVATPVSQNKFDLYTVVAHELGHILGLGDLDPNLTAAELMTGRLQPGQRNVQATDDFFQSLAESTDANWL